MSTRLVVNADDLGLHPGIDEGIFRSFHDGIVRSTTALVSGRTAESAIARAAREGLNVGVHLCLTGGLSPILPASQVASLAPGGKFRASWAHVFAAWVRGRLDLDEVTAELEAQVLRARELGARLDHLDSHQHLHLLPGLRARIEALAAKESLPLRWPFERPRAEWAKRPGPAAKSVVLRGLGMVPSFATVKRVRGIGLFEAGALNEAALLNLIDALPSGDVELSCHPGSNVGQVPEDPSWKYDWDEEVRALCAPAVRKRLQERKVELTTYAHLS